MKPKTKYLAILGLGLALIFASPSQAQKLSSKPSSTEVKAPEKKKLGKSDLLNPKLAMPLAHQDFLYGLCESKNLDYLKTLALIRLESKFNHLTVSGSTHGYFQIHEMHHGKMAKNHKTAVAPLDPYINLKWGTSMLENLYRTFEAEGLRGDKLDRAVLSAFNKGEGGFRRSGEASKFIQIHKNNLDWIQAQY